MKILLSECGGVSNISEIIPGGNSCLCGPIRALHQIALSVSANDRATRRDVFDIIGGLQHFTHTKQNTRSWKLFQINVNENDRV